MRFLTFVPSAETANPKLTTLIQSGCTGVAQDSVEMKIPRHAEKRATRPSSDKQLADANQMIHYPMWIWFYAKGRC
jgi:hypothetical protein